MKQVIVIRDDLKMSPGKIAAQACHASLEAYRRADRVSQTRWDVEGAKVVVVKCRDIEELISLRDQAKKLRVSWALVQDAGFTEVEPGTITALGIGPDQDKVVDEITGNLKPL